MSILQFFNNLLFVLKFLSTLLNVLNFFLGWFRGSSIRHKTAPAGRSLRFIGFLGLAMDIDWIMIRLRDWLLIPLRSFSFPLRWLAPAYFLAILVWLFLFDHSRSSFFLGCLDFFWRLLSGSFPIDHSLVTVVAGKVQYIIHFLPSFFLEGMPMHF